MEEKKENMDTENMNTENMSKENMKKVFVTLMAGELSRFPFGMNFEDSATLVFLDYMKENMPEFFEDKEFLFSLIAWVREYSYCRFRWEESDHVNTFDVILKELFLNYLDESLKNDRDVVKAFIEAIDPVAANARNLDTCPELLELCQNVPHEILMQRDVFEIMLEKLGPLDLYSDILTDEERLDNSIVYRVLKWYSFRRKNRWLERKEVFIDHLKQVHGIWAQTIIETYWDREEAKSVYDEKDSLEALEFFAFVDEFFSTMGDAGEEYIHNGVTEKTILGKRRMFEEMMMEMDLAENERKGLMIYDEKFDYFRHDTFLKIIKPYEYQMFLFDTIAGTNPFPPESDVPGMYDSGMYADDNGGPVRKDLESPDGAGCSSV